MIPGRCQYPAISRKQRMLALVLLTIVLSAIVLIRPTPPPTPRWWLVAVFALLLQLPPYVLGQADWLLRVSYGLLLAVAWSNRTLPGGRWLLVGLTLNALPILVYGRMPLSQEIVEWAQRSAQIGALLPASKGIVAAPTPLLVLGDWIPVQVGSWRAAWSIGDLVLCIAMIRYCCSRPHQPAVRKAEPG